LGVLSAHILTTNFNVIPDLRSTMSGSGVALFSALARIWPTTGGNFVQVFFILSGYLMGKIFWEGRYTAQRQDVLRFYRNRLLRIAPLLYFSLLILICFGGRFYQALGNPLALLGDLFFVNNLTGIAINSVTWSLSYEMQYYLVCPFVFYALAKATTRSTTLALASAAALFGVSLLHTAIGRTLILVPFDFAWLFVGGYSINLAVRLLHEGLGLTKNRLATVMGYLLFAFAHGVYYALYNGSWSEAVRPFANHLASLALFACVYVSFVLFELPRAPGSSRHQPGPVSMAFTWAGRISYGVYLWHLPLVASITGGEEFPLVSRKILGLLSVIGDRPVEHLLFALFWLVVCLALTAVLSVTTFFLVEAGFRPNLYAVGKARM